MVSYRLSHGHLCMQCKAGRSSGSLTRMPHFCTFNSVVIEAMDWSTKTMISHLCAADESGLWINFFLIIMTIDYIIPELRIPTKTLHLELLSRRHAYCTDSGFRTRAPSSIGKSCKTEWYCYYLTYSLVSFDRVVNYHPIDVAIDNTGMLPYRIQIKYHNYFAWHSYNTLMNMYSQL